MKLHFIVSFVVKLHAVVFLWWDIDRSGISFFHLAFKCVILKMTLAPWNHHCDHVQEVGTTSHFRKSRSLVLIWYFLVDLYKSGQEPIVRDLTDHRGKSIIILLNGYRFKLLSKLISLYPTISASLRHHQSSFLVQQKIVNLQLVSVQNESVWRVLSHE